VTWSLDEGASAGSISTSGLYTSPFASGNFHVRATSIDNPLKSAAVIAMVTRPAAGTLDTTFGNLGEFDVASTNPDAGLNVQKIVSLSDGDLVVLGNQFGGGGIGAPRGPFFAYATSNGAYLGGPIGGSAPVLLNQNAATDFAIDASETNAYVAYTDHTLGNHFGAVALPSFTYTWAAGELSSVMHYGICTDQQDPLVAEGPRFARFLEDGGRDPGFGANGLTSDTIIDGGNANFEQCVVSATSGVIAADGYLPNGALVLREFYADGGPALSFGNSGTVATGFDGGGFPSLTIDAQERILVQTNAGNADTIVRFSADGSIDGQFGSGGLLNSPVGFAHAVPTLALEPDGTVVTAWTDGTNCVIARYLASGILDTAFGSGGTVSGISSSPRVAIQPDGKVVVAADATVGGQAVVSIQRYWP